MQKVKESAWLLADQGNAENGSPLSPRAEYARAVASDRADHGNQQSKGLTHFAAIGAFVFCWVVQSEVAQYVQTEVWSVRPYFITWFNHSFMVVLLPVVYLYSWAGDRIFCQKQRNIAVGQMRTKKIRYQHEYGFFKSLHRTFELAVSSDGRERQFFYNVCVISVALFAGDYLYYAGTPHVSVGLSNVLFNLDCVFCYLLSLLRGDKASLKSSVAVALAVVGIVVIAACPVNNKEAVGGVISGSDLVFRQQRQKALASASPLLGEVLIILAAAAYGYTEVSLGDVELAEDAASESIQNDLHSKYIANASRTEGLESQDRAHESPGEGMTAAKKGPSPYCRPCSDLSTGADRAGGVSRDIQTDAFLLHSSPRLIRALHFNGWLGFFTALVLWGGLLAAKMFQGPFRESVSWPTGNVLFWVVLDAALASLMTVSFTVCVHYTSPLLTALAGLLTVPICALVDVWVFQSALSAGDVFGAAFIVAGVIVLQW